MISLIHKHINEFVGGVFFVFLSYMGYYTMVKQNIKEIEDPVYLPVVVESAESLRIGSSVTLLGVPAGIIGSLHYILVDVRGKPVIIGKKKLIRKDIPLSMAQGQFIIAILDLTKKPEIYSNYTIVSQHPSIFTVKTIDIRPGSKQTPGETPLNYKFLTKSEVLALRAKQKIPHFSNKDIVLRAENFGDPLFLLTEIISENQSGIRRIIKNLADITDKLNKGDGNLSALINKKGLERDTVKMLLQVSILSQEVGEGLEAYRETDSLIASLKALFYIFLSGI